MVADIPPTLATARLSRAGRKGLLQLIRARERVAKTAATKRAEQLRADFETHLDTHCSFNTNEVWAAANKKAKAVTREMEARVAIECEKLGIPRAFAPPISEPSWYSRGENMAKERCAELRRLAYSHIDATEKTARSEIAPKVVEAETSIIENGLSKAGLAFLDNPPSADQ